MRPQRGGWVVRGAPLGNFQRRLHAPVRDRLDQLRRDLLARQLLLHHVADRTRPAQHFVFDAQPPNSALRQPATVAAAAEDDARRGRAAVASETGAADVLAARGVARLWLVAAAKRDAVGCRAAVAFQTERGARLVRAARVRGRFRRRLRDGRAAAERRAVGRWAAVAL